MRATRAGSALLAGLGVAGLVVASVTSAAEARVGLGTAESFAVLAAAGVTNTGTTVISGDLGTCPNPAITGAPGVINGAIHANDAVACQAQADFVTAYNDAAGRAPNTTYAGPTDLGGLTLTPGVYQSPTSFGITGTLTLDPGVETDAVFIFQAGSTLITAPNSRVVLLPGVNPCNVFWQVGSSATLGVGSTFVGTILALSDISAQTNATVQGRLLAGNAITLDSNVITRPLCDDPTTTTTSPTDTSTTVEPTPTTSPPDTSTTLPADTSTTLPADTSTTLPADTSTTLPGDTSTTLPADTATTTLSTDTTIAPLQTETTVGPLQTETSLAPLQTGTTLRSGVTVPLATRTSAPSGTSTALSGAGGTTAGGGASGTATTLRPADASAGGSRALASTGPLAWAQIVAFAALGMAMGGLMVVLARRVE